MVLNNEDIFFGQHSIQKMGRPVKTEKGPMDLTDVRQTSMQKECCIVL